MTKHQNRLPGNQKPKQTKNHNPRNKSQTPEEQTRNKKELFQFKKPPIQNSVHVVFPNMTSSSLFAFRLETRLSSPITICTVVLFLFPPMSSKDWIKSRYMYLLVTPQTQQQLSHTLSTLIPRSAVTAQSPSGPQQHHENPLQSPLVTAQELCPPLDSARRMAQTSLLGIGICAVPLVQHVACRTPPRQA